MSEIVISMIKPNNPPIITLNGELIKGIIELNYIYETKTNDYDGMHSFELKYFDDKDKTIRVASVNRTSDDLLPQRLEGSE